MFIVGLYKGEVFMKLSKIFSVMLFAGLISFNAGAETTDNDVSVAKENMKEKFSQIYNFNPNISFKYIPEAKVYEVDLGKQKAYMNKEGDYLYLQGQLFVSKNNTIINMTMPPEEFMKQNGGALQAEPEIKASSNPVSPQVTNDKIISEQRSYEDNNHYDAYQKSVLNSSNLSDLKVSSNFKYVGFEGGAQLPENTVDYIKEIDLSDSAKIVYGNGTRSIILLADPDCPFCQNFDKTLYLNADTIDATIYVMPWALSIHPNAAKKADFIWGQPDRGNAWKSWMLFAANHPVKDNPDQVWDEWVKITGRTENPTVKAPVEKTQSYVEKFGLRYTPTILFPNGGKSEGDLEASKLKQYLEVFDKTIPSVKK